MSLLRYIIDLCIVSAIFGSTQGLQNAYVMTALFVFAAIMCVNICEFYL